MKPIVLLLLGAASLLAAPPFDPGQPIPGAHDTELRLFAKEPFLRNTVAVAVDEQGRVFATSVVRRKAADLDIRQFREWVEKDLELATVEEKRAWLRSELVPDNAKRYKRIGDQNKDGTIDWRDLTVLTDRIIMVEDTDDDGLGDRATTFAEGFNTEVTGIAAGLAAWDGTLYAAIEPDLLALRDTDGDRVADQREPLATGFSVRLAYAGHNFSGPVLGPDGRIYASAPDKGLSITSDDGRVLANPLSGAIFRCELDGSNPELFATGLRNVQEPAFDQLGNLFGVDNDGDMKGEKERFIYITEGSDHGWRNNWQYRGKDWNPWMDEGLSIPHHDGQPAYITPPLQTYRDGPAGFVFNPGTALNAFYKDHFFMTAFPSGKLYAFQVEQDGATFQMAGEYQVASGFLMVGLAFGPDGALYIADWSAKGYELNEKGGVWTLDDPSQATSELREHTAQLIAADWTKPSVEQLVRELGNPDQRVRMKAQFELVRRKAGGPLMGVAVDSQQPQLARLHAIWGLGQHLRLDGILWGDPYQQLYADPDPEVRAQAARTAGDSGHPELIAADPLIPLLKDPADRPRFFAAISLGKLGHKPAFEELVTYLERDGAAPYHRHAAIMGLVGCGSPLEIAALSAHDSTHVRLAAVVALRKLGAAEVAAFLGDADPLVVAEAAGAIHDDTSIPAALPALAALLDDPDHHERTLRRALSSAQRLRSPEHAIRVATFASNKDAPDSLRLLALRLLRDWPRPPVLDPVEGRHRPLRPVKVSSLQPGLKPLLSALMESPDQAIRKAAREAGETYGLGADPDELFALVRKDSPEDSPDALRLLAIAPERQREAARLAIDSKHPPVRAAALEVFSKQLPDDFPKAARMVLASSEALVDRRAALRGLGASDRQEAADILISAVSALEKSALVPELDLDVLEAARNSPHKKVNEAAGAFISNLTDSPLAPYTGTLAGGDAARGEDLFNTHIAAQCIRCHGVGEGGSDVGPNLAGIGTKEPTYLLEALVDPGAAVAPGYGITSITLKDGTAVTGTLLFETPQEVTVRLPDESTRAIPADQIASRTPPVSSMPPMGALLTRMELRDVLAYLQSLR